jgi:hypothetical protein
MLRAIRGLTLLAGWTERTRAEPPRVTRANRVFEDAKAHDSLYSYVEFFRCFRGAVTRQPTDPFSARVRATQQGAIHRSRTSDNHRSPRPTRDARCATRHVFVAEVGRKSGSRRASSEECSSSWHKRSAMIRLPPFRVRRVFGYPSRGGPHSLFRDTGEG